MKKIIQFFGLVFFLCVMYGIGASCSSGAFIISFIIIGVSIMFIISLITGRYEVKAQITDHATHNKNQLNLKR